MAPKPKPFATEVDLCAAFLAALPAGWTAYNETAGWDILLVRAGDGFQIGVQAKLKFNLAVLHQSLEDKMWSHSSCGPDCRAVLIPDGEQALGRLSAYLCLTTIVMQSADRPRHVAPFSPVLPGDKAAWREEWFELAPSRRETLPAYVPDCLAGSSAPVQLTPWKIQALKIAVLMETRGSVTRADFKHIEIDHRRWISGAWLAVDHAHPGRWVKGKYWPDFASQHPRNYLEIKADAETWMPKVPA